MAVAACVPVIPSADLQKSLRFWIDGLGFTVQSDIRENETLLFCMLQRGDMYFMLNRRAGNPVKPDDYEGIRLYWTPENLQEARERLERLGFAVSRIVERDYGQSEFTLTDDDGYSHCFGVARGH
jgi:uncharacterized glyoxalase superfamily protein PhnB